MNKLLQRTIIALVLIAIVGAVIYFNGWVLFGAIVVLALMAEYEIIHAVSTEGAKVCSPVLYAAAALIPVGYIFFGFEGAFVVFALGICLQFIICILREECGTDGAIKGSFALVYPQAFFLFLYAFIFTGENAVFRSFEINRFVIISTATVVVATDTFAYLIGSLLGKHKLCERISPKKSVEGSIAGLVGGALGAVLMVIIFPHYGVKIWAFLIFAILSSVFSQFGDLSASLVKRRFGIKDYSRILGEHGGIMDRLDSFLFVLPGAYFFFFMIFAL